MDLGHQHQSPDWWLNHRCHVLPLSASYSDHKGSRFLTVTGAIPGPKLHPEFSRLFSQLSCLHPLVSSGPVCHAVTAGIPFSVSRYQPLTSRIPTCAGFQHILHLMGLDLFWVPASPCGEPQMHTYPCLPNLHSVPRLDWGGGTVSPFMSHFP